MATLARLHGRYSSFLWSGKSITQVRSDIFTAVVDVDTVRDRRGIPKLGTASFDDPSTQPIHLRLLWKSVNSLGNLKNRMYACFKWSFFERICLAAFGESWARRTCREDKFEARNDFPTQGCGLGSRAHSRRIDFWTFVPGIPGEDWL